jgi:hypothetical protein
MRFSITASIADPDPYDLGLVDPSPDPSIIKQNSKKTLIPTVLWLFYIFEKWCKFSLKDYR